MQLSDPFSAPGKWYQGNLHAHTTNSDGGGTPEEVGARYQAAGHDFLAMTDHWHVTDTNGLERDGFLLIPSVEWDGDETELGDTYHMLGLGVRTVGRLPQLPTVQRAVEWITGEGGLAVIAHPSWSGLTAAEMLQWEGITGIEVFNTVCGKLNGKPTSSVQWDDVLARGRCLWGFAVDDYHRHPSDLLARVVVKATALTTEAILEALRAGCFYSTCGPTLEEVQIAGDTVHVRTSPVREISFMGQAWVGKNVAASAGGLLTEASYTLGGAERYLRIECRDAEGRRAWTNPVVWRG
jgi:hypothetical protein